MGIRNKCSELLERRAARISNYAGALVVWLAILAPLLGSTGCTGLVNAQNPNSQSAVHVVPAAVDFGSTNLGKTVSHPATVANNGTTPVILTQASVSSSEFSVSGLQFPVSIPAGQQANFTVSFKGSKAGKANGTFSFVGDRWSTDPVELTGTAGTAAPQLAVSAPNHNFGNVTVNTLATYALVLSNSGGSDLTVTNISVKGEKFADTPVSLPATIPAGGNLSLDLSFSPQTSGNYSGSVNILSNDPDNPTTRIELRGDGTSEPVGELTATPAALSFTNVKVGTSASDTTTLRNAGNANVTLSRISLLAAGFSTAGVATPVVLVPGETLPLIVKFNPTSAGTKSGTISLVTSQGGITSLSVFGTAAASTTTPPTPAPPPSAPTQTTLSVSPAGISFGSVVTGVANTQLVQLSNPSTGSVTITVANVTGAGFSTSGLSLPLTLQAGQTSSFNVQFDPKSAGSSTGSLLLASNASNSPSVALSGTGIAPGLSLSISPSAVSFGNVTVGSSASRNITVTNTGNSNVAISSVGLTGTNLSVSGGSAVSLSPSQSITLTVQFSPSTAASSSGILTLVSNAVGSPAAIQVTGTGVAQVQHTVSLTWNAVTSTSGYNVYRSVTSGSGYTRINSALDSALSYSDSTVQDSQTYYYVTTSVNSSGTESAYSAEVSVAIP
jgi:hypothetical protein